MTPTAIETAAETAVKTVTETEDRDDAVLVASLVPAPGPHGDDAGAVAAALGVEVSTLLDLSVSMNPFAPSVAAVAGSHLDALARYPSQRDVSMATGSLAAIYFHYISI